MVFRALTPRLWPLLVGLLAGSPLVVTSSPVQARVSSCAQDGLTGTLNMNTANREQWMLLPGIGPTTAAKIIDYRLRRPFRRVSDLKRIRGIGPKTYARLRPFLVLEGETTLHPGSVR